MTFPLLDDEDLGAWITQQANDASLSGLLEPDFGSQPMAAYQAPPHTEMAPLNIDTGPDWSDALGAGTTALAALADLGLNKGKGTGQILAAGGQFGQARAEQRLRGTQDALAYEQKRAQIEKSNRHDDYLYASLAERTRKAGVTEAQGAERIDVAKQNAGTKAAGEARQTRKEDRDTNPDSAYRDAFADTLIKQGMATSSELRDLSYEQMKADYGAMARKFEHEHAGEKAKASRSGTIAADLDASEATGDAAASKAAKVAAATQDYKVDLAGQSAAAREDATGAGARADQNASQGRYNKFRDETEKTRPMVGIAANLDKTLSKYPQDKPGVGMWDSFKSGKLASDDDLAVRGAVSNMTDLVARVRSGAAIPPKEFENIARFVDGGEGATEQQFRVAYSAFKRSLQQEMKEQSRGRESEARDVLGQYGDWALGPMAPQRLGASAGRGGVDQSMGRKPMGGGMVNAGPDGARTYTVSMPGRPALQKQLTEADAQRLRAAGASVE